MASPQEVTPTPSPQTERDGPQNPSLALVKLEESQPEASSEPLTQPRGLGQKARRALNRTLTQAGIPPEDLPPQLRDTVIKKSRKGKAGQIVLRQLSGVEKSSAAQLARKLEHDLSQGRDDICEKLQASGTANKAVLAVAELLQTNPQFSLARAIVEAGADVAHVLDNYARGALALKKMETVLGLYREMPSLMRDLMRHAVDRETTCETCFGEGKVTPKVNGKELTKVCPSCSGTGKKFQSSDHKALAVNKVLEMTEMLPKKTPLVNVNQAVQVNNGAGGSEVLARLSKAADEILYGRVPTVNPYVDAEVIEDGRE